VLDLFCGLGNFSYLWHVVLVTTGRVVGVEASDEMVQRGTENAKQMNFSS
jgi:23S rRNA (uracil1939-C5)-methyltransferase